MVVETKKRVTPEEIELLAWQYLRECIENKKEHPTSSGKVVQIPDRHIPTISYFLQVWIPYKGKKTISRTTYYRWLNDETDQDKCDTIKRVEGQFMALAEDIVANEGKGIFYAKNRLGMNDKLKPENESDIKPIKIIINTDEKDSE